MSITVVSCVTLEQRSYVYIRLSVSTLCLKYLVFIFAPFLFRTFAILSSTMSQSVKLSWLSALTISVVMYNSHKLLIIESVISHLYRMGHCVTCRRLTNSEWWIVEQNSKVVWQDKWRLHWLWPLLTTCLSRTVRREITSCFVSLD